MRLRIILLVTIVLMTAWRASAGTACPAGRYPPKCYPCLGCEPCNDGSGQYCDTVWATRSIGVEHGTDRFDDLDSEILPSSALNLTTTTIEGEYRFDGFSRSFFADPFLRAGVGIGELEIDRAGGTRNGDDDHATLLSIGGGLDGGCPTCRWRTRVEYRYRTLGRVDFSSDPALGLPVDSIELDSHKAEVSLRYLAIPNRLNAILGVRGTQATADVRSSAEGHPSFAETITVQKAEVVAGAEVLFSPRVVGRVEFSSDGTSTQSLVGIQYRFGGGKPIRAAAIAPGRVTGMGCIPRGGQMCSEPGFRCLVMFPDDDWPDMRRLFGDSLVAFNGAAEVLPGNPPKLRYQFDRPYASDVTVLPLEHDKTLPCELASSLGYEQVTIVAGNYAIDPAMGEFGGVVFDVRAEGGGPAAIRPYKEFKECVGEIWFLPGVNIVACGLGALLVPADY